ncbi:MAG: hypothetical protein FJ343_05460 [Sphingomonadales bacterium]|nr:hypothetical protein [Sphingomonadales bacterium]
MQYPHPRLIRLCLAFLAGNLFHPGAATAHAPSAVSKQSEQHTTQANLLVDHSQDKFEIRLPAPTPYEANLQGQLRERKAWAAFHARYPEWNILFDQHTGQPHRIFGPAIPLSNNNACLDFVLKECKDFGIPLDELREGSSYVSRKYRYQWFDQWHQGLQVIGGRLGFKITLDGALVWMASELHPRIQLTTGSTIRREEATRIASDGIAGIQSVSVDPALRILPISGTEVLTISYHLVYTINAEGQDDQGLPFRYECLVDALTGQLWQRENKVVEFAHHPPQSNGNLTMVGRVYPKHPFAPLDSAMPLPHLKFTMGGNTYYTSATGSYDMGLPGLPATGIFPLEGRFSKVVQGNNGTTTPTFSLLIDSLRDTVQYYGRGTSTSLWNKVPHLSAYYHATKVHDYMKSFLPTFTALDIPLTTKVERTDGNCNAFFNGNSINFYTQAGGCNTLAIVADVVYHEYGHAITNYFYNALGTPFRNGAVGEGYSDVYAITLTDTPVLGVGFNLNSPNVIVRRYDINPKIYPQNLVGQVHADGEIICGAWWRTARNMNSNSGMMEIFSESLYGLANGPNGSEGVVYPDILIDALQADDTDNNLANGTPNLTSIVNAFAFHGIRMLANVQFSYPPLSDVQTQTPVPFNVTLNITPPFNTLISGARLIYRLNNNPLTSCDTIVLTAGAGNSYSGIIPAQPRGTIVRYFVGLQDLTGASGGAYPRYADLSSNPGLWFNYLVGFRNTYSLDIENPAQDSSWLIGWPTDNAVTGIWEIGTPIPSYVTPGIISTIVQTGSNATPGGIRCAYTGNAFSPSDDPDTEDVDSGRTTLRTLPMDMTGMADPVLAYHRWYTNDMGDNPNTDFLEVYINNGSTTWKLIERTNHSDRQWRRNVFRVADYVTPNATVQLRFIANDQAPASIVEAAIDQIQHFDLLWGAGIRQLQLAAWSLRPNPFDEKVALNFDSPRDQLVSIILSNPGGVPVWSRIIKINEGSNHLELEIPGLAPGMYLARLEGEQFQSRVLKMVRK